MTEALSRGDVAAAPISTTERALLEFVRRLTVTPHCMMAEDLAGLRGAGWSDSQVAEAVYITALFAFFNRVADAFGLNDPGYRALAAAGETAGLPRP